ncbi:MAG: DNA cytosine methyltransferase [Desulfobacteraceae bacterium]|nr:DNA cytosine methyltransferase [Desulfobacteraceae bacterium]
MENKLNFLDLFAGAGGLSEGFSRAGYEPVAHVEMSRAACNTLRTRAAYHWLKKNNKLNVYYDYLQGSITRSDLYDAVAKKEIETVINSEIGSDTLQTIFDQTDRLIDGKKLDLIIGGPPCQAYSIIGRNRDKQNMQGDKRNYLYIYYAEFLKRYQPDYFVFENVIGLLSAKAKDGVHYFDNMQKLFKKVGYATEYKLLSTEKYGVPQTRKRIILVGKKGKDSGFFPDLQTCSLKETIFDLFQDLPKLRAGQGSIRPCKTEQYSGKYLYDNSIRADGTPVTWHIARPHHERDLEIYRIAIQTWNKNKKRLDYNCIPSDLQTHNNKKSFLDRFKVVVGEFCTSHTVVAHISQDGHFYIHPDIEQNRSLTPREAARIQTFPDDYFFEGVSEKPSRTAAFKQIGNAVPVVFAHNIAKGLLENW